MAIDHDLFSFVDATFHEMPVILVTNPKDARFIVPEKEPVHRILQSTHIRYGDYYITHNSFLVMVIIILLTIIFY